MDLLMPNMDGVTAIGRIKAELPEIEIVTMTSFIEEEKVTAALEAGASGYLLKDAEAEEVAEAIRAAFAGEVHLDPQVARLLAQRMRDEAGARARRAAHRPREGRPAARSARACPTRRSARSCSSPSAPRARTCRNILGKLGLASGRRPRCGPSSTSWPIPRLTRRRVI